ncbi:hypothetical protein F2Q69_00014385 [Brassica cretica]|uniref:Uncharacterized protein n=1 Tax=Brassica cretica TaxID=69181 RepID=A0A8S9R5U4_BRACR|nr:hypothetical protein F2Q69_00014385 [Brassica cretica]
MARAGARIKKGEPNAKLQAKVDKAKLNNGTTRKTHRRVTARETPQPTKSNQLIACALRLYSHSKPYRRTMGTTTRLYSKI